MPHPSTEAERVGSVQADVIELRDRVKRPLSESETQRFLELGLAIEKVVGNIRIEARLVFRKLALSITFTEVSAENPDLSNKPRKEIMFREKTKKAKIQEIEATIVPIRTEEELALAWEAGEKVVCEVPVHKGWAKGTITQRSHYHQYVVDVEVDDPLLPGKRFTREHCFDFSSIKNARVSLSEPEQKAA